MRQGNPDGLCFRQDKQESGMVSVKQEKEMKCACGCGKDLPKNKEERGGRFYNRKHAAKWRADQRRGTKLGPYRKVRQDAESRDVDYNLGPKYCKKYNNDDIKCVMCYEQYQDKECRER
ncbi:MAG: hypothetical protein II453_07095 [Alphaproteobacteria bacterium]|nr:hypothetical protein [Alphaproteobacteria bacterium]